MIKNISIMIKISMISLFILVFQIGVLSTSSYFIKKFFINEIVEKNRNSLVYISQEIENSIKRLYDYFYDISRHTNTEYFNSNPQFTDADNIIFSLKMQRYLNWVNTQIGELFSDIIFFQNSENRYISISTISWDTEYIYDIFLPKNDLNSLLDLYTIPGVVLIYPDKDIKLFNYHADRKRKTSIFALLDDSYLNSLISDKQDSGYCSLIVINKEGDIILNSNGDLGVNKIKLQKDGSIIKISGEKYIYNVTLSYLYNYHYLLLYPQKYIDQKIMVISKYQIITIILLCLLIGTGIYFYYNSIEKPIKKIINTLGKAFQIKRQSINELDLIDNSIKELKINNIELKDEVNRFSGYRESSLLNDILSGIADTKANLDVNLNNYDTYVIINVAFNLINYKHIRIIDNIINVNLTAKRIKLDNNIITYLVMINNMNNYKFSIKSTMQKAINKRIPVTCGISEPHNGIRSLKKAYISSEKAIKYWSIEENIEPCHFYDEIKNYSNNNLEIDIGILENEVDKMMNCIKYGKANKIDDFLSRIKNPMLSFINLRNTYIYLFNHLMLLLKSENIDLRDLGMSYKDIELLNNFNYLYNLKTIDALTEKLFTTAGNYFKEILNNFDKALVSYIDDNFDKGICMDLLIDKFKRSRGYLSSHIKKITGKKYIEYITLLKMKKANELLENTDQSINEIAAKLGYMNVNSLILVFKKRYGMTPGQYRKTLA